MNTIMYFVIIMMVLAPNVSSSSCYLDQEEFSYFPELLESFSIHESDNIRVTCEDQGFHLKLCDFPMLEEIVFQSNGSKAIISSSIERIEYAMDINIIFPYFRKHWEVYANLSFLTPELVGEFNVETGIYREFWELTLVISPSRYYDLSYYTRFVTTLVIYVILIGITMASTHFFKDVLPKYVVIDNGHRPDWKCAITRGICYVGEYYVHILLSYCLVADLTNWLVPQYRWDNLS